MMEVIYGLVSRGHLKTENGRFLGPSIMATQAGLATIRLDVTVPDESLLEAADMTELIVVGAFGEADPFVGLSGADLETAADGAGGAKKIVVLTDADAGKVKTLSFAITPENLGGDFWCAAMVKGVVQ